MDFAISFLPTIFGLKEPYCLPNSAKNLFPGVHLSIDILIRLFRRHSNKISIIIDMGGHRISARGGEHLFSNKTFSGIRNKTKEKGSNLKKKGAKFKKKDTNSRKSKKLKKKGTTLKKKGTKLQAQAGGG